MITHRELLFQVTLKQIIGLYMPGGIYPKDERMVTRARARAHTHTHTQTHTHIRSNISKKFYLFYLINLLTIPQGMWHLSSSTRDGTHSPFVGSTALTIGPPSKSLKFSLESHWWWSFGFIIILRLLVCIAR